MNKPFLLKEVVLIACICSLSCICFDVFAKEKKRVDRNAWKQYVGKAGPSGWRVNVIQPDPNDHGPDGFNHHDWDGDGDLDVLVNYEEGAYSRLYFNPGKTKVRDLWTDYIEFSDHANAEDSCIGDLDNDGDMDYVANGGFFYFNPGKQYVREPVKWTRMTLFEEEARAPVVADIDGDGLNDIVVAGERWYKQPILGKQVASNWKRYELGTKSWVMTCIVTDIDGDGDNDIVIRDRGKMPGTAYYENPGNANVTKPWPEVQIDPAAGGNFMAMGDVNGDGRTDFAKADVKITFFLGTSNSGTYTSQFLKVLQPDQPSSVKEETKPKGIAILEVDGNYSRPEVVVIPEKAGQLFYHTSTGDGMARDKWTTTVMDMPGPETRLKMDNAFLADLDGDGDTDIATTEENGGWGIIWFENPLNDGGTGGGGNTNTAPGAKNASVSGVWGHSE